MTPEELVAEYERTHHQGIRRPGFEGHEHSLLDLARKVRAAALDDCPMGSERERALCDALRKCDGLAARFFRRGDKGKTQGALECLRAIRKLLGQSEDDD